MMTLLYKELKLTMHPLCYVFVLLSPLFVLIPNYPLGVAFIYVLSCYPIIFLGANKGQQSNDLLYSVLLPVRKKEIVKARTFLIVLIHIVTILIMTGLSFLGNVIKNSMPKDAATEALVGFEGFASIIAFGIIGYAIADLIFFPIYYKKGKSIVMSTLFMILGFVLFIFITTVFIPLIPQMAWFTNFFFKSEIWVQLIILGVSIVIYILIHLIVYRISYKRLEKVDF